MVLRPYFPQIEKAIEQDRLGQHESAIHTLEALTHQHGDKPAVWGYFAQFLYNVGQTEKAEEALAAALKLDPNFGMAHFLRGMFRQNEGELIGALMLFRKAVDAYDPEAHDSLSQVYELIFRNELIMNRPLAARFALEQAVRLAPGEAELAQSLDAIFGPESRLPACAARNTPSARPPRPCPRPPPPASFPTPRRRTST